MTIYLVRHGSAGVRHDADPSDTERHLDAVGLRQAARITDALRDAGVQRIISSPAVRCIETVEPLAATIGCHLEIDTALLEGTDIEHSWALAERFAVAGETAVLASHGDVIPDIIRRAKGRGMEVPGKAGCSKGSMWTLTWDGERFDCGVYIVPK